MIAGVATAVVIAAIAVTIAAAKGHPSRPAAAQTHPAHTAQPLPSHGSSFPFFPGTASQVIGRVTDTKAGISWAKYGQVHIQRPEDVVGRHRRIRCSWE